MDIGGGKDDDRRYELSRGNVIRSRRNSKRYYYKSRRKVSVCRCI